MYHKSTNHYKFQLNLAIFKTGLLTYTQKTSKNKNCTSTQKPYITAYYSKHTDTLFLHLHVYTWQHTDTHERIHFYNASCHAYVRLTLGLADLLPANHRRRFHLRAIRLCKKKSHEKEKKKNELDHQLMIRLRKWQVKFEMFVFMYLWWWWAARCRRHGCRR